MQRPYAFTMAVLFCLTAGLMSCAGSGEIEKKLPLTIATVKPAQGYIQKVAVTLTRAPSSAVGKRMGDLFLDTLVRSIHLKNTQLQLVTPKDAEFPSFMAQLGPRPIANINAIELAEHGRRAGYNGLVVAALRGIRPYSKKTGILWFRKERYFISFDLTVDLYDPLTAAKIVGVVEEASIKVSDVEYEAFQEGVTSDVEELEEEIIDFGEEIGELVGESLKERFWRTSIVKVDDQRIYLPAGRQSGLAQGVRLAVFEGRRIIDGQGGERFIVPGPQVDTIQISDLGPDGAEAVSMTGGAVQVGDIAVPVR